MGRAKKNELYVPFISRYIDVKDIDGADLNRILNTCIVSIVLVFVCRVLRIKVNNKGGAVLCPSNSTAQSNISNTLLNRFKEITDVSLDGIPINIQYKGMFIVVTYSYLSSLEVLIDGFNCDSTIDVRNYYLLESTSENEGMSDLNINYNLLLSEAIQFLNSSYKYLNSIKYQDISKETCKALIKCIKPWINNIGSIFIYYDAGDTEKKFSNDGFDSMVYNKLFDDQSVWLSYVKSIFIDLLVGDEIDEEIDD